MQIALRGKNLQITQSLREYVEKKVGKIEKYFDNLTSAQVTLGVEKDRRIVEVTIPVNGIILRGEEATGDMYSSIDLVMDKLEKQVEKYRTQIYRRFRREGAKPPSTEERPAAETDEPFRVVKTKRFPIKPMAVDEAIMQMNLVGHDFFVFANAETEKVNVIYRRHDGDYGLIEPEF
ncbi:MAG: ribosome hibernation-promoting factor, HPF/YfiA family [Bacillota bacterium]